MSGRRLPFQRATRPTPIAPLAPLPSLALLDFLFPFSDATTTTTLATDVGPLARLMGLAGLPTSVPGSPGTLQARKFTPLQFGVMGTPNVGAANPGYINGLGNPWTLACKLFLSSAFAGTGSMPLGEADISGLQFSYYFYVVPSEMQFLSQPRGGGPIIQLDFLADVPFDDGYHDLVFTGDTSNIVRAYCDAIPLGTPLSRTYTGGASSSPNAHVNGRYAAGDNAFNTVAQDLQLWTTAWSDAQVATFHALRLRGISTSEFLGL